eukprot:3414525-Pyramimonas_sp.AAC.1
MKRKELLDDLPTCCKRPSGACKVDPYLDNNSQARKSSTEPPNSARSCSREVQPLRGPSMTASATGRRRTRASP